MRALQGCSPLIALALAILAAVLMPDFSIGRLVGLGLCVLTVALVAFNFFFLEVEP